MSIGRIHNNNKGFGNKGTQENKRSGAQKTSN